MNNNRFCTQKKHQQVQTTHLCLFYDCRLLQRQCCIECINEGIHNHGKDDQEHIKLDQVIEKVQQKLPQVQNDKDIKPIDLRGREYKVKEIASDYIEMTADISNDEKYLAYGGIKRILKIYHIQQDRIIKQLKINGRIQACQFSFDSAQLYVALGNVSEFYCDKDEAKFNEIIGYDVKKNFKKIFQYYVQYKYEITETIITIQNQYLITFGYGEIRKIDIKRNKQIFKLIDDINTIDYNQQYDMIIIGGNNGSIKLWDFGKRIIIINEQYAHEYKIYQIQFIKKIQNVLSLDQKHNLYKWSVDLINKKLIKLQEYQDPYGIISFSSINQNQNLLLICGDYIKIVDDKGHTIKQIDLQCGDYFLPSCQKNRQLDNAKYIYFVYQSLFPRYNKPKISLLSALE